MNQLMKCVEPRLALSYDEAAQQVGTCRKTVENWVKQGKLPCTKIGGRVFIRVVDLESLLNPQTVGNNDGKS